MTAGNESTALDPNAVPAVTVEADAAGELGRTSAMDRKRGSRGGRDGSQPFLEVHA